MVEKCSICELSIANIGKKNVPFVRKVTSSGKSLVVCIPEDIVRYMGLSKGCRVRIIPASRKQFIVEAVQG